VKNDRFELEFAVYPDEGGAVPAAVFRDLGDAMEWAVQQFGSDRFAIRRFDLATGLPAGLGRS
jgi:hypothetical protein